MRNEGSSTLKNLLKPILLALFLIGAVLGGYYTFQSPELRPVVVSIDKPPILKAEPLSANLGDIETDGKATYTFQLYNEGGKSLKISKVDASCGCTTAKLDKNTLKPGEHTPLNVTLDTSIKLGQVVKTVEIFSNDPKHSPLTLTLKGNVIRRMVGHTMSVKVKDPLVLFKGECATCHVKNGIGKSGQQLFAADCAMCHGSGGQGNVSMPLVYGNFDNPSYVGQIRKTISHGSPRTPTMPPFSKAKGGPLTESQIDSIINYLAYQSKLRQQEGITPDHEPAKDLSGPLNP